MSTDKQGLLERAALRTAIWAERWFPDAFIFAAIGVVIVAIAAMLGGATPAATASAFGEGFWSLIPFTMQMTFVVIGGYVVASSPPAARLIEWMARRPKTGRGAICQVALFSMLAALLNWGFSLIFGGLLVRALARRKDLDMDYRAAAAAAYLGLGAVWAMGLSSSAAQLQANPASIPASLLKITGVIPFAETLFLWQSLVLTLVLIIVSMLIAYFSAPRGERALRAADLGIDVSTVEQPRERAGRPGEWLEYSPLLSILLVALALGWIWQEFASKSAIVAISSLNTYNFLFLMIGLLLHWRPRHFLDAVARAVPSTTGVLIQFPLYGGVAAILTTAKGLDGQTLTHHLSALFVQLASHDTFAWVIGAYSALLGFFVPSGGGKWVIEAPYVMQAANDLQYHLGWSVQIYNAAEALPNLINPFWMLPLLGVLGLKARDIVGFTFLQLAIHLPLVLFLLWALGQTLTYHAPVLPS
ncbi:short-chain fatty acid transporter [Pseudolysobacter antarcticus]|uniref:Short-chain fatty acid transporter n=1 Tax=Pseudolysobacter antarcticus TaxID=2511995 RepID=A0A411HN89_9GAMM|nr:TIGR00366 family protein [Pseudolysobacter antarcticus]QBB71947.1 short-chain fatty acid transporter [Pseudolysobacter antarcticus]